MNPFPDDGFQRHPGTLDHGPPSAGTRTGFQAILPVRGFPAAWTAFAPLRWGFTLAILALCCGASFAADKSGVSPNTISLPKGPGSIEGLGESFQPTLNTGTAKYSVGLKVPPGTAGQTPSLALVYEGGSGNGLLGFGWQMPLASVQRRTDHGIPTYGENLGFPREDTFINDSKEELVPQANGNYFCKNEGAFIRYRFIPLNSQPSTLSSFQGHWEATLPDGTHQEFGLTEGARIQEGTNHVFSWLLERETDTRGNTILYTYTNFPGDTNLRQRYLASIRYGPGAPPWANYHFVAFQYEDRADWFEDCRAGFAVRTGKRLKSIVVGTHGPVLANHAQDDFDGDGTTDNLVRRYDLDYTAYAGTNSHWSLLGKVTMVGADGVSSLPPSTFGYAVGNPPDTISAENAWIGSLYEPPWVMDNPLVDLVDLNGDGLPDILKTEYWGGQHTAFLNRGVVMTNSAPAVRWEDVGGVGGDPQTWSINLASQSEIAHLADMDGDGLADLVFNAGFGDVYYFTNRAKVSWGNQAYMSILDFAPPAPFGNPSVRTADLDFDKRMDVIQSVDVGGGQAEYEIWFNLGGQTYSHMVTVPQANGFLFGQSGVQITDFNGDRVPDIVRVTPMAVIVTPGLGYGRFGPAVAVNIPTWTLDDDQVARAKLTDINGDGLADLVIERAGPGELWYWINLGNYTFSRRKIVTGMPSGGAIRLADINGNGSTDIAFADSSASPRVLAVDLGQLMSGAPTPNLLTAISNGIGRVTLIGYEPSTKFALEDAAAGHPWPDPMPFPVQVVASVTNLDSLGHQYVSQFRYHDSYYDSVEKQFRGFARVEQVDLGDVTAPTLVTRSHFDTGRNYEVMKGKILRLTAEQEDGLVFTDESTAWTLPPVTLYTGTNGVAVHYAHPLGRTNIVKELGQGTERLLESELDFDNFGNHTRQADYGIVVAGNRTAFNDERITTTEYAINTNAWILRTPARQETKDENGAIISRAEFFYDDETFAGNNRGLVTIGNLTMKREWKDPANSGAFIKSTRTKYDSYGNPTTILDPLANAASIAAGHAREIAYDTRFHTFPVTETIHLGSGSEPLVFQAAYDEGFGTVTSSTDFNGNQTTYSYDVFARLTSIVKPGDTAAYPTVEYDYALAVSFPLSLGGEGQGEGVINYVETRQLDKPITGSPITDHRSLYLRSRQFVDGLGRKLLTKTEAEPAPGSTAPRVVVSEATQFNARQKPARVLNPFFSYPRPSDGRGAGGEGLDDLLAFEHIEAPGWTGSFALSNSLVTLDLASAHATRTAFDATLRPTQVTNPDGTFRRTVYEPLLTRSFDENDTDPASANFNTPMVHYNDGLGRLIQVDETTKLNDDGTPSGTIATWTTRYEYDLNDQLTRITDSQNNVKTFAYDGLKRKTDMNDPDRGVMHFDYDDASNLTETTDAKAQRITYTYDGANRIRTEKYHDGLPAPAWRSSRGDEALTNSVVYHYDTPFPNLPQGDNTAATAQNVKGALAWVEDLAGEEHTSYDSRGRVESVVKRIPDPLMTDHGSLVSYATRFAYDSLDRLTNLTYPDADQLRYEYNDRNLLQRIPGGPSGSIIAGIAYQPSAQMGQIDYGNGVRTTYAYDSRLRLQRLHTLSATGGEGGGEVDLIHFLYDFDGVSNIKSIADLRPGSAVPEGDPRRNTQLFRYDDLYRLTRVQYSFALPGAAPRNDGEINYRYDRIGNMLAQISTLTNHVEKGLPVADLGDMDSGGAAGRWNRTGRAPTDPPGPHALTTIRHSTFGIRPFPYDANGNMTNIDGLVCAWDFKDRLVAVENNEMRAAYTYDYTDRRIIKDVACKPGSANFTNHDSRITTLYINKYFEVREHDAPTKYVWNGNTRVARVTGSLNTNVRVQRLRLWPGWNLCSLAVSSPSPLWGEGRGEVLSAAFRWNPTTLGWDEVLPSDSPPAGTVLWLKASTNATLTVTGAYADPTNRTVPAGGDFLPSAGLEIWNLKSQISNSPTATAWTYDAFATRWLSWLPPPLSTLNSLPAGASAQAGQPSTALPPFIAPGEAVFVRADAPAQLEVPDSALRIRYYHQDHVGSSSSGTDAQGSIVEETALFPFGQPRHELRSRSTSESYQFAQKERDFESKLHYVEARFLTASLGRFTRVDTMAIRLEPEILEVPQGLNPYAYSLNNPLKFHDPSGDVWGLLGKVAKVVIKGGDIASTVAGVIDDVRTLRDPNASGWDKAGAVLSLASEVLSPVSIKDIKGGVKTVSAVIDSRKALAQKADFIYDAASKRYRDTRTGRYTSNKNFPWPENTHHKPIELKEGMIVDRYGPDGPHVGLPGSTVSERGLPPGSEALPYHQYRVKKSYNAKGGLAKEVPEFKAKGGGFEADLGKPISELKDYFEELK